MNKKVGSFAIFLMLFLMEGSFWASQEKPINDLLSQYKQTMEAMRQIALAIKDYSTDFGFVPRVASAEELGKLLRGAYIKNLPQDAWGHDFLYKFNETKPSQYWLASAGSDGLFEGFDQYGRWEPFQGQDIILTNEPSPWICAPNDKGLALPDVFRTLEQDEDYPTQLNPGAKQGIVRRPPPADFSFIHRGKLEALPTYDPNSDKGWQVDLRSTDISGLDLQNRLSDLLQAEFDSKTRWPASLPAGFDPAHLMEFGKNPGLGLGKLHQMGITGKGVGLAIIDQTLLVDHAEYKNQLRLYEEIHNPPGEAAMHGPAVASIAVGKTVGVAPGADLYYIAETHGLFQRDGFDWDFAPLAQSIDRILEINGHLPAAKKIRVISISVGWSPGQKGYAKVTAAVEKAKKAGIFVVSSSISETYDHKFYFQGLGREPMADPDSFNSYEPGSWWSQKFFSALAPPASGREMLLVPMDSRCTASPTGVDDYVFYRQGGWSWSIPYLAGLYALACQIKPGMTPELFWSEALRTGETIEIENNGKKYPLGKIVNPVKLLKR
jgi:hypothetical protein